MNVERQGIQTFVRFLGVMLAGAMCLQGSVGCQSSTSVTTTATATATVTATASTTANLCEAKALGAKGDGVHKDTQAIQAAIDQCASKGGGVVQLSSGRYLSAPIFLESKVTLQIDRDAILLASQDPADYEMANHPASRASMPGPLLALVNAVNASDIAIVGGGTIDGAGAPWWESVRVARQAGKPEPNRPRLVVLAHVQNVRVEGITLTNSPSFHLVPHWATDVVINDVTIKAPETSPNTDGIDPSSSHNVRISHCTIDNGDDNIAIKSGEVDSVYPDAASSDIVVSDCTFLHGHGMSIGSETNGGVRNVLVQRCTFRGTEIGLRIKSARGRGGDVSQVTYRDLEMQDVHTPLEFVEYYPSIPEKDMPQPITATTPAFHGISVVNIVATGGTNAGIIVGLPEKPITDVTLSNVQISAETGIVVRNATVQVSSTQVSTQQGPSFILQENGNKVTTQAE